MFYLSELRERKVLGSSVRLPLVEYKMTSFMGLVLNAAFQPLISESQQCDHC